MKAEVRPASAADIPVLAARMRQADRDEVMASHGHDPESALRSSLAASTMAWTGWINDEPACMFGVGPISVLAGRGAPWMLGTDLIDHWPRLFLRRSRGCVQRMLAVYPYLENFADERNVKTLAWLRWLGFRLAGAAVTLPSGARFRHFEMGS